MPIDVTATELGLDALALRINAATSKTVRDVGDAVRKAGATLAPKGTPGNSTAPPGELAASILVDGPHRVGTSTWMAQVGPTTIYGRQRELGGPLVPVVAAYLRFVKFGTVYYTPRVYQKPHPYMKPALAQVRPTVAGIAQRNVAAAIVEGGGG